MYWKGIVDKLDHALRVLSDNYVSMHYSLDIAFASFYFSEKRFSNIVHPLTSGPSHHYKKDI